MKLLYDFILNAFRLLQQPRNNYELIVALKSNHKNIEEFLRQHVALNNVQPLYDFNPNKYILTTKGQYTLYKICQLNEFMVKYDTNIKLALLPGIRKMGKKQKKLERELRRI